MATLATFFRRSDLIAADTTVQVRTADPFSLRGLPADDIYFFSKRVDNSRLVRQADPKTRTDCWSTIATACLLAITVAAAVSPRIGNVLQGYRTERLRVEQRELMDKRRTLEIQEARMLSPSRLGELASRQKMTAPISGQEVQLQPKDASFAMNVDRSGASSR
jgi:hypothetical protein